MKRYCSAASLALAIVAVLGLARPASAQQQVPFLGRLAGVVTRAPLTPPYVSALVTATGNATLLGQFQLSIPHTVNTAARTAVGSYQFTAANGDTLSASFGGKSMLKAPGVLAIVETATITGGTGRFAGATGAFICQRLYNTVTGRTTGSFSGTISVPVAGQP
jgi:hypothetical protein